MAARKNQKAGKTAKKLGSKKEEIQEGTRYACGDCGLVVTVNDVCGCPTYRELVCCGEPMALRECY